MTDGQVVCGQCAEPWHAGHTCPGMAPGSAVNVMVYGDTVASVPLDPADARELARLGKKVADYTERRNAKIREVIARGAGPREVGRAVGLSHASVINIVTPRRRQGTW